MRKSTRKGIRYKDYRELIDDEVFEHQDFKRHIKEVATKLDLPDDVVETVIQQFVTDVAMELRKVQKQIRRLIIPGWLHIDIVEPQHYKFNNIKTRNHARKSRRSNDPSSTA